MNTSPLQFPRRAGIVVPLFSIRGRRDMGTGGILDLIPFVDWLASWQQRIVQLLPINERSVGEASPYNALSAFAIDPAYIDVARLPDVAGSPRAQEWLGSPGGQRRLQRLRLARTRHRQLAYTTKLRLLQLGFEQFNRRSPRSERAARFEGFCQRHASWLDDYALFRSLKESFGWASWETWPNDLRQRDSAALRQAATSLASRLRFFRYVQWIAAEQWEQMRTHARKRGVLIKGDLPFVCGRDSADVWAHQDLFDLTSSAGAPPDAFSATGQAWGLPLYNWAAMRASGFAWWRQRAWFARELYDVFRIDHVVGLYRTYAIPLRADGQRGFVPADEHEQYAQGTALMQAILDEAGDALVVAEDLGTVPEWVRASLTELGIPGYKVFRWEQRDGAYVDPRTYPPLSVTTTGTHDTDTLVTWWETLNVAERDSVWHLLSLTSPAGDTTWEVVHLPLLRRLYESASALTVLPIQDLFGWRERINTPATVGRRNWRYRLPGDVQTLDRDPAVRARLAAIREMIVATGRSGPT